MFKQVDGYNAYVIICNKNIEYRGIIDNLNEWYLVDDPVLKKFPYKYTNPKKLIEYEVKKNKREISFSDILKLLDIKEYYERFEQPWIYLGNNKWICSVALGIARDEKFFLMPWMYKSVLEYQEYRNKQIFNAIKNVGGVVVFPVEGIIKDSFLNQNDVYRIHMNNVE